MTFSFFRNILIGVLLGVILLFAVSNFAGGEDAGVTEYDEVFEVSLISPSQLAENASYLVAYGTATATQDLDLSFQMNGVINKIYVSPGDMVNEGDLIAVLDNAALAAQLAQVEAAYDAVYNSYLSVMRGASDTQLKSARSALEVAEIQLEVLQKTEGVSEYEIEIQEEVVKQYEYALQIAEDGANEETLDAQWALVEQAQAGLAGARAGYQMSYLIAPFSGEITTLSIQEGEYAMATVSVGKIVNRENIEAVTYLSSEDADSISVGNHVLVDNEYEGYVLGISSVIDSYTGKRKVRVQMDGLGDLTVGDTVEIDIAMDRSENVTLISVNSLLLDDDQAYVYFYHDGAVYKQRIKLGEVLGEYVEVIDIPKISIVENVKGLRNGLKVQLSL